MLPLASQTPLPQFDGSTRVSSFTLSLDKYILLCLRNGANDDEKLALLDFALVGPAKLWLQRWTNANPAGAYPACIAALKLEYNSQDRQRTDARAYMSPMIRQKIGPDGQPELLDAVLARYDNSLNITKAARANLGHTALTENETAHYFLDLLLPEDRYELVRGLDLANLTMAILRTTVHRLVCATKSLRESSTTEPASYLTNHSGRGNRGKRTNTHLQDENHEVLQQFKRHAQANDARIENMSTQLNNLSKALTSNLQQQQAQQQIVVPPNPASYPSYQYPHSVPQQPSFATPMMVMQQTPPNRNSVQCYKCHNFGHFANQCNTFNDQSSNQFKHSKSSQNTCFICKHARCAGATDPFACDNKCIKCGGSDSQCSNNKPMCPANKHKCNNCHKTGHFPHLCMGTNPVYQQWKEAKHGTRRVQTQRQPQPHHERRQQINMLQADAPNQQNLEQMQQALKTMAERLSTMEEKNG